MPIAITSELSFTANLGGCASYAAVCAAPLTDDRSTARAITARDGSPFIIRSARGGDAMELPESFGCPCSGGLTDADPISDVFGSHVGEAVIGGDEPAQSEARPTIHNDVRPDVVLDARELVLRVEGRAIGLTRTQFSILSYLVENSGRWVTTSELIRQVLGTHHQPDTSLVRVHVHAIRRRLGGRATWLESDRRRARGYRWRGFAAEREEGAQDVPSEGRGTHEPS